MIIYKQCPSETTQAMATSEVIHYFAIDDSWWERIARDWSEKSIRHLHFSDGFTIIAAYEEQTIGIISMYWRGLPVPVADTIEGYIDFLEVKPIYRRRGIATRLIALTVEQARKQKAYQVRAWSSADKIEAIPL